MNDTTPLARINITNVEWIYEDSVAYSNPENAEIGNPNGDVYQQFVFIIATTESGRRFRLAGVRLDYDKEHVAVKLVERIRKVMTIDERLWVETYEVYGSPAWERADQLREMEHQSGPLAGTVRDI